MKDQTLEPRDVPLPPPAPPRAPAPPGSLTFREYLLGCAIQGLLAGDTERLCKPSTLSCEAVEQVQSLLEMLGRGDED